MYKSKLKCANEITESQYEIEKPNTKLLQSQFQCATEIWN